MWLSKDSLFGSMSSALTGLFVTSAVLLSGCGAGTTPTSRRVISGEVQLDGKPLDQGAIQFEPADGATKLNAGTTIADGKFQIPGDKGLPPGKYKVSITSVPKDTRSAEQIMNNPGEPPKERIAARFNTETTLTAEVSASGKNTFEFKVESIAP